MVVPDVAARIDTIVSEVAFTDWRESTPGDRAVKKELRGVLKQFALPVTGELFDRPSPNRPWTTAPNRTEPCP